MVAGRAGTTLAALGEFGFLRAVLPKVPRGRGVLVGPGQDCASVDVGGANWLLTVDSLVEGVHFRNAWLTPFQLGLRSYAVNASDIAAMGGRPRYVLVNLAVPPDYTVRDLTQLQKGIVAAAGEHGASVVGGNLTRASQLAVTITLVGLGPSQSVTRQGARPGDLVYVTGTLGDAAFAVDRLSRGLPTPPALRRRYQTPTARVRAGQALIRRGLVSAMIDVSDGLLQDLGHLGEQSGVGAEVEVDRVPRSAAAIRLGADISFALSGGEDYELLFTVPPEHAKRLHRSSRALGCPITPIGKVVARGGIRAVDAGGHAVEPRRAGFDHFAAGR